VTAGTVRGPADPVVTVRPPYMLYRLEVRPVATAFFGAEPAVHVAEVDEETNHMVQTHVITPNQARDLAAGLQVAACEAGRAAGGTCSGCDHAGGCLTCGCTCGTEDAPVCPCCRVDDRTLMKGPDTGGVAAG
jgi:hypothetical protein